MMERDHSLIFVITAVITSLFLFISPAHATDITTGSPIGYWKIIDDVTGKPKSIVHIFKTPDQILMGKIVKVYSQKGAICTACVGSNRNQPVTGMVILSGLKNHENQWNQGEILDPENGKTYNCSARLAENGKKLNVKGYIGLPLFGRSQTWERVDLMSG